MGQEEKKEAALYSRGANLSGDGGLKIKSASSHEGQHETEKGSGITKNNEST